MTDSSGKIKLLIVDDSRLVRKTIANVFDNDDSVEVVGEATNGKEALTMIPALKPDVITLDIEMPEMDGLSALKHLMIKHPAPTLMLSTLTQEGSRSAFDALKYGAVDFIHKITIENEAQKHHFYSQVADKVKKAAIMKVDAIRYQRMSKKNADGQSAVYALPCKQLVALGASMGGYGSLLKILPALSPNLKAALLVIVYMPNSYIGGFVKYLNDNSAIHVKEAKNGMTIDNGVCFVASAENYLTVAEDRGVLKIHLNPAPFGVEVQCSINMLFYSISEVMGEESIGIILAGTGKDGIEGVKEMVRVGGKVIVQDTKTCIETEMPETVIAETSINLILPDTAIADAIVETVGELK
jgi:two-component system chemotaxis response regulator CheB